MYRKCKDAKFALFLIIEMRNNNIALAWQLKFQSTEEYNSLRGCVPTVVAIALYKRTGPRMGIFRVKKSLKKH